MKNESVNTKKDVFVPTTEEEINQFMIDNQRIIHKICQEFKHCGIEYDDLVQEASIGFLKGIRTYSPDKGSAPTTYCYTCARTAVLMVIRAQRAKGRSAITVSMDAGFTPNGKDKEMNPADVLTSTEADQLHTPEASLEDQVTMREMTNLVLKYAHECLTDNEYKALMMWYNHATQDQIAKTLHISQATASKLIHFAHGKLRWYMNQHGYFTYDDVAQG